jgi:hypothetical protein
MADSFLAYQNPTVTDKKLDSESLVVGANTVERERMQMAGAIAAAIAGVLNAAPAVTDYGLVVRTVLSTLTASAPTAATVGVASASAVAANAGRKGLVLINTSNKRISLGFGSAAVLDSGVTLFSGDVFIMDSTSFSSAVVNAIASGAASNLSVQEYT